MIQIHSERLLIRDNVRSDLDAMHAWISAPEVMRFLDWKTSSLTETKTLLDNVINEIKRQSRKYYFFAVVHKESNNIIGDIGFTLISGSKFGGLAD